MVCWPCMFLVSWDHRHLAGLAQYCPVHSAKEGEAVMSSGWEGGSGCKVLLSFTDCEQWSARYGKEASATSRSKCLYFLAGSTVALPTEASGSCLWSSNPFPWEQISLDCATVNLDRSSSLLSFAVCGCHSYEASMPLNPPLCDEGAQTYFLLGPRSLLPIVYIEFTLEFHRQWQFGPQTSWRVWRAQFLQGV